MQYAHINNMAAAYDEVMNKRFEEAFDFIKHIFKVEKLYDDQVKLIKAFCNGSNVFFNAPTGYGESIVYQCLPWVFDMLQEQTIGFSTLIPEPTARSAAPGVSPGRGLLILHK